MDSLSQGGTTIVGRDVSIGNDNDFDGAYEASKGKGKAAGPVSKRLFKVRHPVLCRSPSSFSPV